MHTELEQWAANAAAPGEQLWVRCLAQGTLLSRGQFLPEPRFEPTTLGYKSDALSIRAMTNANTFLISFPSKDSALSSMLEAYNDIYSLSRLILSRFI